jgi:hypothetical protein
MLCTGELVMFKKSIAICRSSEAKPDISGVEAAP